MTDHYYIIDIKRSDQYFFRPCAGTVKTEKEALQIVDSLSNQNETLIYRISEVTRKTKKIIRPE